MESKSSENSAYYAQTRGEMLKFIPDNAECFLEVGCADGSFGSLIKSSRTCVIWGVEPVYEIAQRAINRLDNVISSSVESGIAQLPLDFFDCVICNDVLEHLTCPDKLLSDLSKHLKSNATIVGSIPNIRYFPVIYNLIVNSDWKYSDYGVLDRTHLRFYTGKSLIRLLEDSGYTNIHIEGINPTTGIRARLLSILSFGLFRDCLFQQYAFTANPKKQQG